jgi:hypothetical protein
MILFSHKGGQLGNRLFTFAHLIANAAEYNIRIVNLSFDEYAQYFQTTGKDIFCRYPASPTLITSNQIRRYLFIANRIILKLLRKLNMQTSAFHGIVVADLPEFSFAENKYFHLSDKGFQTLASQKPMTFLFGRFFRDYPNFEKHQNVIRQFFRPNADLQANIDKFMENVRKDARLIIGVHIRRGDYAQFIGGKYFYPLESYLRILEKVQTNMEQEKIRFVLCSNEKIDRDLFKAIDFVLGPGHFVEDMYVLSACDLILGPPSTFSTWASFYGNKPICQLDREDQSPTKDDFKILSSHMLYNFG